MGDEAGTPTGLPRSDGTGNIGSWTPGGETIRAAAVMTAFLVLPSHEEVGRVPLP